MKLSELVQKPTGKRIKITDPFEIEKGTEEKEAKTFWKVQISHHYVSDLLV